MRSIRMSCLTVLVVLFAFGSASADFRSGMPILLKLEDVGDLGYAFDGSPLEIPFTLTGTGAAVYLAVYPGDARFTETPELAEGVQWYDWAAQLAGGKRWHGYAVVHVSEGKRYEEGSHVITWDGRDLDGNPVPSGDYSYFLYAVDEQSQPTVVAVNVVELIGVFGERGVIHDPPVIWTASENLMIYKCEVGIDWYANPDAYESWDLSGILPEGAWFAGIDYLPSEPDIVWPLTVTTEGPVGDHPGWPGWRKIRVKEDGTAEVVTDWADNGVYTGVSVPGANQVSSRLCQYEDKLYVPGFTYWNDPADCFVDVLDFATGEFIEKLDLTDSFGHFTSEGELYSHGPMACIPRR